MGQIKKWRVASGEWRVLALLACLLIPTGAHAAPRPEAMVLRGTGRDGSLLALRVPLNVFAQLQAAGSGSNVNLNQIGGGSVSSSLYDSGNTAIKVNCVVGCSATSGFSDSGTFTAGTTAVNNISGVFNDGLAALASGTAGAARITNDRMLFVNIGKIGGAVPSLTGSSLNVNCTGGCGTSSFSDSGAFTAGSTAIQNVGGVFNDGLSAVSSGNAAAPRITSSRAFHVNLRNNSGTEVGTSGSALYVQFPSAQSVSQSGTWNVGTLTSITNALPTGANTIGGVNLAQYTPASGRLPVDGSGVTQPVSGTVTANAGTGTFGVSGTVTANQGTAQTAANGWPIRASDGSNLINVGDNANSAVRVNVVAGGGAGGTSSSFNATFPAAGTAAGASDGANMKPLLVDASGFLKVNVAAGGGSGGTSSSYGAAFPATGTAAGFSDGTNMQGARVFDADTGAGTQYVAGAILRKSASGGSVEVGTASDPLRTDPTGTTTQPVSGTVTANAGTGSFTVTQGTGSNLHTAVDSLPSVTVGTFPDNEPFNLNQVGGNALATGGVNGTLGVGGTTAAGSAAAGNPIQIGATGTGNVTRIVVCDSSAAISTASSGSTQLVALTSGQSIYVCGYNWLANGTVNVKLVYGTGTNCGTGSTDMTGAYNHTAQTGIVKDSPFWNGLKTAASNALCVNLSAAIQVSGVVLYTKF